MKKPHESMWRTGLRWFDDKNGRHEYGWGVPITSKDGEAREAVVTFRTPEGVTADDACALQRFHEAAPDMARALLALTSTGHTTETLSAALDAGLRALAKAGVTEP